MVIGIDNSNNKNSNKVIDYMVWFLQIYKALKVFREASSRI